ncbi:MAG: hypothetical protein KDD44_05775 [Bdellovibrionales bacterium]|nr:hypothetical protein [Bdellovibrionales bacterium]
MSDSSTKDVQGAEWPSRLVFDSSRSTAQRRWFRLNLAGEPDVVAREIAADVARLPGDITSGELVIDVPDDGPQPSQQLRAGLVELLAARWPWVITFRQHGRLDQAWRARGGRIGIGPHPDHHDVTLVRISMVTRGLERRDFQVELREELMQQRRLLAGTRVRVQLRSVGEVGPDEQFRSFLVTVLRGVGVVGIQLYRSAQSGEFDTLWEAPERNPSSAATPHPRT